eukprot:COSAG02_NODE_4252_length_5585_cov_4.587614_1_plen_70_part_00
MEKMKHSTTGTTLKMPQCLAACAKTKKRGYAVSPTILIFWARASATVCARSYFFSRLVGLMAILLRLGG